MALSFGLVDFVLITFALQGLIIAGLLFYLSKAIVSNRWLGAAIFIVSESTLIMELDRLGIWNRYPIVQVVVLHFLFALGPVIYFYTRSLIFGSQKLTLKNWLHFAPLLIDFKVPLTYVLYASGLLYIPLLQNIYFKPITQHILFDSAFYTSVLSFISVAGYSIVTYLLIIREQKNVHLSANKLKDLKWLKTILHSMLVLMLLWFFSLAIPVLRQWGEYVVLLPSISLVYLLGMAAWRRQTHMTVVEKEEYALKPVKVYYTPIEADVYARQLNGLMAVQQLYLNPVLKVEDLAAELMITEKVLSNLINQHLGKNFNDYINEYRIAEVKQRLADPRNSHFTIAAIAYDCGFNSLTTFQRVFKQLTGTTPSKFQSNLATQLVIK